MRTLTLPFLYRRSKTSLNYNYLPPDLALWLTLSGSNYPCLEQIYMVPIMFELLRSDCIRKDGEHWGTWRYTIHRVGNNELTFSFPAGTWVLNNVASTSMQRHDVDSTLFQLGIVLGLKLHSTTASQTITMIIHAMIVCKRSTKMLLSQWAFIILRWFYTSFSV